MEEKNYEISVKKWGWTTMSFLKFIKKYYDINERVKIITNPKKCNVSHIYENRELTLEETIQLFADYDYSLCEKNYYDLEQYLNAYGKFEIEVVTIAKNEMESILLVNAPDTMLKGYLGSFPNGLYSEQVRELLGK